jgi:DNA-binding response OmpR family regulator
MVSQGLVWLVSPFDDRGTYAEHLSGHAMDIVEWNDYGAAVDELARSARRTPDAIVIDVGIPKASSNALSCVRALRDRLDAATSIVVISGHGRQPDRDRLREAGADRFLIKPALPRDVLYDVRRALASHAEGTRLAWKWRPPWNWTVAARGSASRERRASSVPAAMDAAADR